MPKTSGLRVSATLDKCQCFDRGDDTRAPVGLLEKIDLAASGLDALLFGPGQFQDVAVHGVLPTRWFG